MNCNEASRALQAYADGELDAGTAEAIGLHVKRCADCGSEYLRLKNLSYRLRREVPYFSAPAALRERLAARFAETPPAPALPRTALRGRWNFFAGGALAGCVASVFAMLLGTAALEMVASDDRAQEAVTRHVSATLDHGLVAVLSSDQHTVKPWLSARLDYSPPVEDLANEGYPLVGGRVDTLQRQPVATLVYRHRQHTIDVYVRPLEGDVRAPSLRTVRGFNVAQAYGADMEWVAVSDMSGELLSAFVERLAHPAPLTER
jgi:anti-sigma factor RsiW